MVIVSVVPNHYQTIMSKVHAEADIGADSISDEDDSSLFERGKKKKRQARHNGLNEKLLADQVRFVL